MIGQQVLAHIQIEHFVTPEGALQLPLTFDEKQSGGVPLTPLPQPHEPLDA